ncbi:FAD:protein FMN transferase [Sphingomonas sp. TZW2008]|uniref:FAD:protein FMN transferase n=1 Tax=Sphingomonas sp. TZW2008 TaxID=1917973 RepID=UPI0027D82A6E|nr:FAD:protein FMN transferase [Sphingomonas sp. TZW2008]
MPRLLYPAALAGWDAGARLATLGGAAMGTTWAIRLVAPPGDDLADLRREVEALLARLVAQMSHWEPASLLSQYNRAPADSWTALPREFAAVMATALDVAARSDGAFDPAIGALVDLWGYGAVPAAGVPDAAAIDAARAAGGWQRVRFDRAARRLYQPGGVRLDLSGIAKGYAVDAVAALLASRGVRHCLVEIGGEFVGRGMRPDGDPWWVELETPGGVAVPIRVALHQLAVATSGDYVRGRHTIDSRTGHPVDHALVVSVLHASAMVADAWATALGVLGAPAMVDLATNERLAVRALLREGDRVHEWISPALAEMLAD